MSNLFPGVVITCDTREQSALLKNHKVESAIVKGKFLISEYSESELYALSRQRPRIFSVYEHFIKKGSEVGIGKLDRCDYAVSGFHRDFEISLGIEYKQLNDLMSSWDDLHWKLWESQGMYKNVSLCIEGRVDAIEQDGLYFVRNFSGPEVLRYDIYQAKMAEWQELGVQVRQFEKLDNFAPTLENLVDYVSKGNHRVFEYKEKCPADLTLKILCQIPGIKLTIVQKLLKDNPEMTFAQVNEMSVKELQGRIGKKTGEYLWSILHGLPEKKKLDSS